MKGKLHLASGLLAILMTGVVCSPLVGCASLGLVQPSGYSETLAAGYQSVTSGARLTGNLLDLNKLSTADARNVHTQLTNFKEGLDVADQIHVQDAAAGEAKLKATLVGLDALIAYLQSKQ